MKKETLEEAAKEYMKGWGGITNSENSFIAGAKWQAERMYSEEEVFRILYDFVCGIDIDIYEEYGIKEWFEQFKKE
jgi:hypothetical protein